jgi:hypothetical protein
MAETSTDEQFALPQVENLVGEDGGRTTDELLTAARACGGNDEEREFAGRWIKGQLDKLAEDGHVVERDGRWYLAYTLVGEVLPGEDDEVQELTPQEIQRRAGLTQKQAIKAIDHLGKNPYAFGSIKIDWDGWDVDDPDKVMTKILGEGWDQDEW